MKRILCIFVIVVLVFIIVTYCLFVNEVFEDGFSIVQEDIFSNLYIPTVDIKVPVYDSSTGNAQSVVDRENSAAHLIWRSHDVFVDHQCQTFKNLADVAPYATIAYVTDHQKVNTYVCVQKTQGKVIRTNGQGTIIYGKDINKYLSANDDTIFIYTCSPQQNDDNSGIVLTYWQPINAI